jgi:hypothetical protein
VLTGWDRSWRRFGTPWAAGGPRRARACAAGRCQRPAHRRRSIVWGSGSTVVPTRAIAGDRTTPSRRPTPIRETRRVPTRDDGQLTRTPSTSATMRGHKRHSASASRPLTLCPLYSRGWRGGCAWRRRLLLDGAIMRDGRCASVADVEADERRGPGPSRP